MAGLAECIDMSHGGHTDWTKYVDTVDLISHVCLGTLMETGAGGDSEYSDEDTEEDEEVAVSEFSEESEEDDDVEEANVESLISFVILIDLLIFPVRVVILSGCLDRN